MNLFIIATAARLAAEVVTGGPCHVLHGRDAGTLYEINYGRELIARVTASGVEWQAQRRQPEHFFDLIHNFLPVAKRVARCW